MKRQRIKKIICILAAILTVCALPSGAFAAYGFGYLDEAIYFERDSAGGWTDYVQNEYHLNDENGALIYCVEGGNPFCWDELTQYVGWDATIDALYSVGANWRLKDGISVERYLQGLVAIASWGYPYYIPAGMDLPEARYATSAAMHVYTALCVNDPASAGFGKSYWGEYEPVDRMRPKASVQRSDLVYDWFTELYWKGLDLEEMPHSVSFSEDTVQLSLSGDDFTGQVTVHLENMLGGYVIDQDSLDRLDYLGGSISGYTGADGDVLTVVIPKYRHRFWNYTLRVKASDPRNSADFGIVTSTWDPDSYQKCVGFMGVAGQLEKTASCVLKTGNYGLPLSIQKASSEPWTAGNAMYSLEGAQFMLKGWDADKVPVTEVLTLDAEGKAFGSTQFGVGYNVEITELSAPSGFKVSGPVTLRTSEEVSENIAEIADDPLFSEAGAVLKKQDQQGDVQGNASLEGAEYSAHFYGGLYENAEAAEASGTFLRSWVLKTDPSGLLLMDEEHKVSGDAFYMHDGAVILPLGTLVLKEQKASDGYSLDPQTYVVRVKEGDSPGTAVREGDSLDTSGRALSLEPIKHFGIRGVKLDAQKNAAEASGDAVLSGGRISVINRSDRAVTVAGRTAAPGETAAEMVTAANGSYFLSAQLPYGKYEIIESRAPAGYETAVWSCVFEPSSADEDGKIFEVPDDFALKDPALLQDLVIRKWDSARGVGVSGAVNPKDALEGISFEVINRSQHSVVWGSRTVEPGETIAVVQTAFDEDSGEYRAALLGLPYGTYGIKELASAGGSMANHWYLADSLAEVQIPLHNTGPQRITYYDVADSRVCRLEVSKTVSGNMGSRDKDFSFELVIGDNSEVPVSFVKTRQDSTLESGAAVFEGGKHLFSLKHGESIVFEGIVSGNSYKVTEPAASAEGYILSWTGEPEGILNEDVSVDANNDRNAVVSTGLSASEGRGVSTVFGGFAGAALLLAMGKEERNGRRRKKKPAGRA